ncbi:MAG: nucleotidyltransferase domain-containing protein [Actinomycetota bacterium]
MPVRSLSSSVLRWPDRAEVDAGVRRWASMVAEKGDRVRRIGYFGSYAQGDWGVGSDVDLAVVVERSELPFERRALEFDATGLPVPADLPVHTVAEWDSLLQGGGWPRAAMGEVVWVCER